MSRRTQQSETPEPISDETTPAAPEPEKQSAEPSTLVALSITVGTLVLIVLFALSAGRWMGLEAEAYYRHRTSVHAAGDDAAYHGIPVEACPYSDSWWEGADRKAWLEGWTRWHTSHSKH